MMGSHGTIIEPIEQDLVTKISQFIAHPQRDEVVQRLREEEKNLYTWEAVTQSYYTFLDSIDIESTPARFHNG